MINDIIKIAYEAGLEIMKIYKKEKILSCQKYDSSPFTEADKISNTIIFEKLALCSRYPIMSEEFITPYKIRKNWKIFWLIDPLDGTKDYISKNGQFTINIALIKNNKPILGVVYAPSLNEMYYAEIGKGAYKNSKKIYNKSMRINLIAADSNFHSSNETSKFLKEYGIKEVKKMGSSLKVCKLAEGLIDLYPRFNETKEWDTAAAHIIANEAGCKLVDVNTKKELLYNKKDYRNNSFIASRNNLEFML